MYFLYSLLLTLGLCALLPFFLLAALRHGKYLAGLGERLGGVAPLNTGGCPVIWLHCVSVGEAQAARPLAQALLSRYPSHALVVSTTTLTGQQLAREVFRDSAAAIFYFPLDWKWTVRRTLRSIRPALVLIMETELWPRFLRECHALDIPVALVNGRVSERSFRGYRRLGPLIRRTVNDLSLALTQTEGDAARLRALGLPAERIQVSGNVKFDVEFAAGDQALTVDLSERFGLGDGRSLIVAASTHAPEEAVCLAAFTRLRSESSSAPLPRLLIAPRHPERFAEVAQLLEESGLRWSRRSAEALESDRQGEVILLDSIGEVRAVYSLAELVFVGGSIARTGGHNVLEPAAAGKCVITGAHTFNFAAVVHDFLEQRAMIQLPDEADALITVTLARTFRELLDDGDKRRQLGQRAWAVLSCNRGATTRSVEMLAPLFQPGLPIKNWQPTAETSATHVKPQTSNLPPPSCP
ncbi:MAG: 3-deoxy-D-manno-octulosonic acid transferase [Pyrinomonadaceae bacterium]|nr:3-deoxy-D-manno-octulosonic acid transferase [Pyrinomonadaceae bacterium]